MSIFGIVTGAISLGAEFGLSSLIGNVAATVTTKSGNKIIDKICIGIGTAVLSGMAADAAGKWIENKANDIRDAVTPDYMLEDYDTDFDDESFANEPEVYSDDMEEA